MFTTRAGLRPASVNIRQGLRFPSALHRQHPRVQIIPRQSFSRSSRRLIDVTAGQPARGSGVINFFRGAVLLLGFGIVYVYITDTRASVHKWVVIPTLRYVYPDPEEAHEAGNRLLKQLFTFGIHPRERGDPDKKGDLEIEVFGTTLRNPIGTSAGIDKHAEIPDPLFALGPSIIEIGGTTPQPQPGNDKPRVFRLTNQNAMINRYGLNSEGADHVALQLKRRVRRFAEACGFGHDIDAETAVLDGAAGVPPGSLTPGKLLAVNIAKNKATPETDIDAVTADYLYCAGRLAPYADILVVNVSSPNTPGLRTLQTQESLTKILSAVVQAAQSVQRKTKPAVMVKVSPDEDSDDQVAGICQAVWASDVDGIIVGNTTNSRPEQMNDLPKLSSQEQQHLQEQGGFSGPHLFEKTLSMVKKYKKLLDGSSSSRSQSTETLASEPEPRVIRALQSKGETPTVDATGPVPHHTQSSDNRIINSIHTESIPLQNLSEKAESEKQPLFRLPTDKFYDQPREEQDEFKESPTGPTMQTPDTPHSKTLTDSVVSPTDSSREQAAAEPVNKTPDPAPTKKEVVRRDNPKVIFATGGVTNGKQALEILNAGASVAMVYTALVYGGVGTISKIKDEMRQELNAKQKEKKQKKRSKPSSISSSDQEKAVATS